MKTPFVAGCLLLTAIAGAFAMQERRVVNTSASVDSGASQAIAAGGLIYVSAIAGMTDDGKPVGPDVASQARRILERLSTILEGAGSSLAQTASVNVYLARAEDFDAMNKVYREFFGDKPPTRTTVAVDVAGASLIEMSAVSLPTGAPRETLLPAGWMKSPRPYSYIVRSGDLVFLSGLVSRRGTDDQTVIGSARVQTKTILENARTLLKTAGLSMEDVVSARVFVTDDTYFDEMNEVFGTYFASSPPARATAVTGLMGPDAKVEITLIASSQKQVIGPQLSPTLPVSTAVRSGPRIYLAGVLGNTDTNVDDPAAQARETLTRIGRTLESAGLTFGDVVDATIYMPDLWRFTKINDVYREFFPKEPPARTAVGAKLIARSALVEMMMTAVK